MGYTPSENAAELQSSQTVPTLEQIAFSGRPLIDLRVEEIRDLLNAALIENDGREWRKAVMDIIEARQIMVSEDKNSEKMIRINTDLLNNLMKMRNRGVPTQDLMATILQVVRTHVVQDLSPGKQVRFQLDTGEGRSSYDLFVRSTPRLEDDFTLTFDGIPTTFDDSGNPRANIKEEGSETYSFDMSGVTFFIQGDHRYE